MTPECERELLKIAEQYGFDANAIIKAYNCFTVSISDDIESIQKTLEMILPQRYEPPQIENTCRKFVERRMRK